MRMSMRRFTHLISGFPKKLDNHMHPLALYFMFYNFTRVHTTLRISPAMAAGIIDRPCSREDVVATIDAVAPPPQSAAPIKAGEANSN